MVFFYVCKRLLKLRNYLSVHTAKSNHFSKLKMNKNILVVFDFDHTIVDDNSDMVARKLLPKEYLKDVDKVYKETRHSWTLYMKEVFRFLHKANITNESLLTAIKNIPPIKEIDNLIKALANDNNNNYELIIISDSNSVFIDEWLKANNLENVLRRVITNPAWFESNGLLNIEFYHHQDFCKLSEPNLCKGFVMENYITERNNENVYFNNLIYIGDGNNDFCPTLKLKKNDIVFPRLNYALFKKIKQNENEVKAQVFPWQDGSDIINVFNEKFQLNSK